jgi:hypothetical protein
MDTVFKLVGVLVYLRVCFCFFSISLLVGSVSFFFVMGVVNYGVPKISQRPTLHGWMGLQ